MHAYDQNRVTVKSLGEGFRELGKHYQMDHLYYEYVRYTALVLLVQVYYYVLIDVFIWETACPSLAGILKLHLILCLVTDLGCCGYKWWHDDKNRPVQSSSTYSPSPARKTCQ